MEDTLLSEVCAESGARSSRTNMNAGVRGSAAQFSCEEEVEDFWSLK